MTQPVGGNDAKQSDGDGGRGQGDSEALKSQAVVVSAQDLPLHCPGDKAPLWSMHPRVFLDVTKMGSVKCPYCGTVYTLAPGTFIHGHGH